MRFCGLFDKFIKRSKRSVQENVESKEPENEVKLLFLGPSESGKSTIFKRLTMVYGSGYTEDYIKNYRSVIINNCLEPLKDILEAMHSIDPAIKFNSYARQSDGEEFLSYFENIQFDFSKDAIQIPSSILDTMNRLWLDEDVQKCFERSNEYYLIDSAKYFLDSLYRICKSDYIPDEQDFLRSQVRTTGFLDLNFIYRDIEFHVWDVGGNRGDRRRWIYLFDEHVTAIIFCVSLGDYDKMLDEDNSTNQLQDSLELFDSICNNSKHMFTKIILLLNKKDILAEKITKTSLKFCFPMYDGADECNEVIEFIKCQFEAADRRENKTLLDTYITCAVDTDDIKFVFDRIVPELIIINAEQNRERELKDDIHFLH